MGSCTLRSLSNPDVLEDPLSVLIGGADVRSLPSQFAVPGSGFARHARSQIVLKLL